jgi:hypothetical protein
MKKHYEKDIPPNVQLNVYFDQKYYEIDIYLDGEFSHTERRNFLEQHQILTLRSNFLSRFRRMMRQFVENK